MTGDWQSIWKGRKKPERLRKREAPRRGPEEIIGSENIGPVNIQERGAQKRVQKMG